MAMVTTRVKMEPPGFVSLEKHVAAGYRPGDPNSPNPPAFVFPRRHAGHVWLVAGTPLTGDVRWNEVNDGKHVYVPLCPYVVDAEPTFLFGFAWQLAALALGSLPYEVLSLQIAVARPAEDLFPVTGERKFRVHAGLAVRVK